MTRAQLIAASGDVESAIAIADATCREAEAVGSTVNEVWARTVAAHLRLRVDPACGTAEVKDALGSARRFEYHAAISVGLRSLAAAAVRDGDHASAAASRSELFDGLIARSGVADLHGALQTTAALLHATGDADWAPIAATVASLPLVGLTGRASDPALALPEPAGVAPLTRREAIVCARAALRRVRLATTATDAPAVDSQRVTARFVDRGDLYEITFAARTILAKKAKGLTDLATLLASQGREVHCLDLAGAEVEQTSTGDTIDATARSQYEQRIRDLQADLEAAERDNDLGRTERLQVELDALIEQLASALGLAGRARGSGSTAERARSAVTQRIRATIRDCSASTPNSPATSRSP